MILHVYILKPKSNLRIIYTYIYILHNIYIYTQYIYIYILYIFLIFPYVNVHICLKLKLLNTIHFSSLNCEFRIFLGIHEMKLAKHGQKRSETGSNRFPARCVPFIAKSLRPWRRDATALVCLGFMIYKYIGLIPSGYD